MLLLHQVGSVKIGEVVRYTVSYTPSQDRILPSPEKLHVRVRNTSAIALRAAFVHGPYTLSVAAYPAAFSPNDKFANPRRYGVPAFEPMLKAGGAWECELVVPDDLRQAAGMGFHGAEAARWVVEVSSQVIFSPSAAVGFELVVARDRKSLGLSQTLPGVGGQTPAPQPGRVSDHQPGRAARDASRDAQPRGVFSRAVAVAVEDTATLWNTPRLPGCDDDGPARRRTRAPVDRPAEPRPTRQKRVHLVVLTHGLHSNLGADMLFIKESIDAAARQAKLDARARRARERRERASRRPTDGKALETDTDDDDDGDDEEVIVRGYSGNATKTERGIKYLGKRLARYVLSMTYPDQPFFPIGKGAGEGLAEASKGDERHGQRAQAHKHSTIQADADRARRDGLGRPYRISSISFVAHSLGGLVQMYAVAYIQKHSPHFFDVIQPVNFVALASPFLGLSNENPLYVKFALDFGLVGRTGQDLGLTWRAPTIARSGWGAIVGNLGESAHKKVYGETQPESKPLLRILPTGPAHTALRKFRNRTVYSNVVNDGIVPLRTSCLLFLDWQGLGRVEKARRDAGLVETVVGFGWAELTGTNMASPRLKQLSSNGHQSDSGESMPREAMREAMREVPQPATDAIVENDRASIRSMPTPYADDGAPPSAASPGPFAGFFNLFKSSEPPKEQPLSPKQRMILRRGQTMPLDQAPPSASSSSASDESAKAPQPQATSGHELDQLPDGMTAPPKTTFFESAGDLLNPSLPDMEYLLDPAKRPRTIFHDRVYHPSDIPPPPLKRRRSTLMRRRHPGKTPSPGGSPSLLLSVARDDSFRPAGDHDGTAATGPDDVVDGANMRVEEKIARGYHRDLSWRKVLVKLEPDAHNNICVRRMFANAYGWPVIKHLVDAHFSDSAVARARTDDEHLGERTLDVAQPPDEHGAETKALPSPGPGTPVPRDADAREALDQVPDLPGPLAADRSPPPPPRIAVPEHSDSVSWSDRDWVDSDNDSDADDRLPPPSHGPKDAHHGPKDAHHGRLSPSSWSWAEKIVGKGARARSKSPNGPQAKKA